MKRFTNKILMIVIVVISGYGLIISCTHKNEVLPPPVTTTPPPIVRGHHVHLPGLTIGDTSQWKFDKAHSAVNWSGPYEGVGAPLTGKFNQFGVAELTSSNMIIYYTTNQPIADTSWAFYESEPAKTHFSGYVQTNQVNTGEPARDGGCLLTTFGTTKPVAGQQNLTVTNVAYIKTTSIAFDPNSAGYIATFNFTWQGGAAQPVTHSITGKLTYVPEAIVPGSTSSAFGLTLEFQINKADYSIVSTNISDKIDIVVSANFNNK